MKILYILLSFLIVIILIYYYYIHDFIFNRVVVKKTKITKNINNPIKKSELKTEEIFRDYTLQDGDVSLSINKKKSDFTKTIIRRHRLESEVEEIISSSPNSLSPHQELKNYNDYELEGSAFENYEDYVNLITSSPPQENEYEYPKLEDITIIKDSDVNLRNPVTPCEYLQTLESYLENPELINDEMGIEDEINLLLQKNNAFFDNQEETKESEILIDLENISEKISDNKENILNFNAVLSNVENNPKDNTLDFGIDFDETI